MRARGALDVRELGRAAGGERSEVMSVMGISQQLHGTAGREATDEDGTARVLRPSRRIAIFFNRGQIDPQASISMAVPLLPTKGTVQPRIRLASTAQKLFWHHWGFANE